VIGQTQVTAGLMERGPACPGGASVLRSSGGDVAWSNLNSGEQWVVCIQETPKTGKGGGWGGEGGGGVQGDDVTSPWDNLI